jgi:Ca-activated chloride channel family protein
MGNTAMYNGIITGLQMLTEARAQNPTAKCMLFVLTDGENTSGRSDILEYGDVKDVIFEVGIPVYTIGFNANISVLSEISSLNEAASVNADNEDVVYRLSQLFNAEM